MAATHRVDAGEAAHWRCTLNHALQAWAVARGDDVVTVMLLCPVHASWPNDPDFALPFGLVAFRVRARAWVRRLLRSAEKRGAGCTECAIRAGRVVRAVDAGPIGNVKVADLAVTGGEA
jgi:hypothetical protein